MSAAPDRKPCPVPSCSNAVPMLQLMCTTCWGNLSLLTRRKIASLRPSSVSGPGTGKGPAFNAAVQEAQAKLTVRP